MYSISPIFTPTFTPRSTNSTYRNSEDLSVTEIKSSNLLLIETLSYILFVLTTNIHPSFSLLSFSCLCFFLHLSYLVIFLYPLPTSFTTLKYNHVESTLHLFSIYIFFYFVINGTSCFQYFYTYQIFSILTPSTSFSSITSQKFSSTTFLLFFRTRLSQVSISLLSSEPQKKCAINLIPSNAK